MLIAFLLYLTLKGITFGIRALNPATCGNGRRNTAAANGRRFNDIEFRNQVTEWKIVTIEGRLQLIDEGIISIRSEMAEKINQLHELFFTSPNKTAMEELNGKGIIGSAPSGSNYAARNQRHQGHYQPANRVSTETHFKPPKLNFHRFNGIDPKVWIRKYQKDVVGEFQRLKQTTTVLEFQERFEELQPRLIARNLGLSDEFFLACFMSGLKGEIINLVKMFKPPDLNATIQLARLQEAAVNAKRINP
ncbi:hypothetical protein EZV62_000955 [Acer yangbiense]|uniref:Retrotransposon gag domain-containing protein n=1 Tax=Acer yangbiense TaxID=1000413 RepID=A0A5C7IV49_9ROSI|nr:hypothetical protein EZV62_000955 [Acer yangbiense]